MNTEQFRYFAILYDGLSYPTAAKKIPMSTQGLIKAIRKLQLDLGVELFTQNETGALTPTSFADELINYVRGWSKDWECLLESFDRVRAQEQHMVRLGASMGVLGLFGPAFFSELKRLHPDITVNYQEGDDDKTDTGLRDGLFDLAVTLYPYDDHFITTELFSTPIAFWVHKNDPLSRQVSISVQDLQRRSLAWPSKGYKIYETINEKCSEQDVKLLNIYESEQMFVIHDYVRRGEGLGFTLPQINAHSAFSGDENTVCVPSEDIILRCGLSRLPTRVLSPHEQRFYDFCVTHTRYLPEHQ